MAVKPKDLRSRGGNPNALMDGIIAVMNNMLLFTSVAQDTPGLGNTGVLTQYTMPANTMDTDGQILSIKFWGTKSGTAAGFTFQWRLGGTVIHTIGTGATGAITWFAEWMIGRTGSAAQKGQAFMVGNGGMSRQADASTSTKDFTTPLTIDLNVSSINAADQVFQEGMSVELLSI